MKNGVLLLLTLVFFGACGYAVLPSYFQADTTIPTELLSKMKLTVTKKFLDPESAQFRNLKIAGRNIVHGEVNAKNTYGGYVGFRRFIYSGDINVVVVTE